MPFYSYRCASCSDKFELLQLSSDVSSVCPACGSQKLQKLITRFATPRHSPLASHTQSSAEAPVNQATAAATPKQGCPGSRASELIRKYDKANGY